MNLSMKFMFFIALFYACWMCGVISQTMSVVTTGIKFGIISRTLFGLLFVCCSLMLFLAYRLTYWKRNGIPYISVEFPYIFGNFSQSGHRAEALADFYKDNRTEHHPIIGIYMFTEPSVLIVDLDLARSILNESFSCFQDRGMYRNEKDDPLSATLGSLKHDKWQQLRPKLTPALTSAKIKEMFPIMGTVGIELVKGLNEIIVATENQVEVREFISRFTTDIIGSVLIGIQCNSSQFREMTQKAMKPYLKFPLNNLTLAYPNFARSLFIRKYPKDLSDFFLNVLHQTIQFRKENSITRTDFMQLLIDSGLETNEIAALAFDLFSAGYADSTSVLTYCLYELALPKNRKIQEAARDEIKSVLKQNNGLLTNDVLPKLVYCKKIINETLRKHPVAGAIMRVATKAFNVPNTDFTIPKGMLVFIPILGIHHDEHFYPNPEEFIPERFPDNVRLRKFLPFGEGQRQCIGLNFAKALIQCGLVSLLQHFEFSTCERTQIPIVYSSTKNTLVPSDGIWLNVERLK